MVPFAPGRRSGRSGRLSPKEKLIAMQRVISGESKASVARYFNVPESTLRGWFKSVDRIQMFAERQLLNEQVRASSSTIPRYDMAKALAPNQLPQLVQYKSNGSSDSSSSGIGSSNTSNLSDVIDLTTPGKQFDEYEPHRSGSFQSIGSISSNNSEISEPKSVSSLSSSVSFQETTPMNNLVKQDSVGSTNVHSSISGHSSNLSLPPTPTTPQSPAVSVGTNQLWQIHEFNQRVIERMARISATSESVGSSDFNFNLPEGLSIRPSPAVQPVCSPKIKSTTLVDREQEVSTSEKMLTNNNNNNNNENYESIEPLEAMRYAERFAKWFQTYSDPTLTTQDVMRFEQLLGKVKKIVERQRSGAVEKMKQRRK